MDGSTSSSSPSAYASTITSRLAVPSYIDIDVSMVGNASGGTAYISVTAEEEPSETYPIKVWSVIIEDHEMAGSTWGYYNNMEMMWIPVVYPLGAQGNVLNFTGPYPQTISVSDTYTLNPVTDIFDNLNVVTFVQYSSGTRAVLNSHYMDLPDTATGVYGDETASSAGLTAGPNPSTGFFSIHCLLPAEESGNVQIFDLSGRVVESYPADAVINTYIEESGVYFVQLSTSSGELIRRQLTVIR